MPAMARLTDITSYADAQAEFSPAKLWELFDGDREHLNIAHECIDRHVGRAAHDLNNVCASMLGFTSLAQDLVDTTSPLAQYLKEIELATQNAIAVAQRLHQLSSDLRRPNDR